MAKEGETTFSVDIPVKLNAAFKLWKAREGGRDNKVLGAIALYLGCTLNEYQAIDVLREMRQWLKDGPEEIPVKPPGEAPAMDSDEPQPCTCGADADDLVMPEAAEHREKAELVSELDRLHAKKKPKAPVQGRIAPRG